MRTADIKKAKGLHIPISSPYHICQRIKLGSGWTDWSQKATGQFMGFDTIMKQIEILRRSYPNRVMEFKVEIDGKLVNPYGETLIRPFQTGKNITTPVPKRKETQEEVNKHLSMIEAKKRNEKPSKKRYKI